MTRAEIIAEIRSKNPNSEVDGIRVGPGDPAYEALIEKWADAYEASSTEQEKERTFRETISAGYLVSPEGYRLKMDDSDRQLWSQQLVLLREAEALGAMTPESYVLFLDINGVQQSATLARFRQIMVGLGQAFQVAFFARYGN